MFMKQNRWPLLVSSIALMLGASACSPTKNDKPPAPKTADAAASAPSLAAAAKGGEAVAALPKFGPAPSWKLSDVDGKPVKLEDFKGKVVVLDFWATWCPPCRAEIPGYTELQEKYGKEGLMIVGVSVDEGGPQVVKPFMAKMKINYPIVMGDDAVATAYGAAEAIPTTILIDRDGQIRHKKVGSEETSEYEKKILAVLHEKA